MDKRSPEDLSRLAARALVASLPFRFLALAQPGDQQAGVEQLKPFSVDSREAKFQEERAA